jgi:predicted enzyme related to lactoylglutathione lyase/AcrR family transcriptional regulator
MVHGTATAREFHSALFGWELRPGPRQLGPDARALPDGREVAGIGRLPPDRQLPVAWTPYFASDDVDATAEAVRLCGGTVGVGPPAAADAGRLAICSDPAGAVFGVWQAARHAGTGPSGVPGAPAWNELLTYGAERVAEFYGTVFGHEREPAGRAGRGHVALRVAGRPVAGVRGLGDALPRERGPHWVTYFQVTDVAGIPDRLTDLGGHVLRPPHDGPRGRTAVSADPEGARFSVLQVPRRARSRAALGAVGRMSAASRTGARPVRRPDRGGAVPTGVALRDARGQLFRAAERILLRDGPNALTSRAVTAEAGCAKGVLHRHFDDFDTFLTELVQDRVRRIDAQAAALRAAAGTGAVADHLTRALTDVFDSVALGIVKLLTFRDEVRARLRRERPVGVPVAEEATAMIASYLAAERDLGRIADDADVDILALTLVGSGHLLFAGREGAPPAEEEVRRVVDTVLAGVVREPDRLRRHRSAPR